MYSFAIRKASYGGYCGSNIFDIYAHEKPNLLIIDNTKDVERGDLTLFLINIRSDAILKFVNQDDISLLRFK